MTENPAEHRLKQVVESEGFLELARKLDEILGKPVWWYCPDPNSPIKLLNSNDKRECGLLNDDEAVREDWHKAAIEGMKEVEKDQVGLMTVSPPGHVQVIVPVLCSDDLHGFIGVSHLPVYEQRRLPPLLSLLVEHLRQIAERARANEDLVAIRRLWNEVVSTLDLGDLLDRILEEILFLLDSKCGVLLLSDPDRRLTPRKSVGFGESGEALHDPSLSATPYENKMKTWGQPARLLSEGDPLRDWFIEQSPETMENHEVWGVPLLHVGHLYSLVLCCRKKGAKFGKHLETSLDTLTLGSSVAIRNALEFEHMRQKSVALSTVHSVYRLMSSTRVANDLLHRMANLTLQVLNSKKCSIMLADPDGTLRPCVSLGLEEGEIGTRPLRPGEGIPGFVAEEGVSLRVYNPREDPRFSKDPEGFYRSDSYLSVPLYEEDVVGVITIGERIGTPSRFSAGDREVLNTLAEQTVIALMNIQYFEKQEKIALKTMGIFENLFETGDPDVEGRSQKLASLLAGIADLLKIDEHTRQSFQMAAFLHSLGSLGAQKEETDFSDPFQEEAKNTSTAIRMAKRMDLPENVIAILRDHLEHFDGSGGPRGLKGEEIPLGARLLSLCEAFLNCIEPENGEPGLTVEEAMGRIEEGSGTRFDPNLVEALKDYVTKQEGTLFPSLTGK